MTASAYSSDEERGLQALVYRELVRQAVVMAALHSGGRPYDAVFDGEGAGAGVPSLAVTTQLKSDGNFSYRIVRDDGAVAALEETVQIGRDPLAAVERLAKAMAERIDEELPAWLEAQAPFSKTEPRPAPAVPTIDAGALAWRMDPVSQFELLRYWHARAASEGHTPAVLDGLAMTYATLGELTRYCWNAFPTACTARALLYVELRRLRFPGEPGLADVQAWVYAFTGYHHLALASLTLLRGWDKRPEWFDVLDDAMRFRTEALIARAEAKGRDAAVAALFGVIGIERTFPTKFFEQVFGRLEPVLAGGVRGLYAANETVGVSDRLRITTMGRTAWWGVFTRRIPMVADLPAALKTVVAVSGDSAVESERRPMPIQPLRYRNFFMESQSCDALATGYPRWGVLGKLVWDTHFFLTVSRLYVMADLLQEPTVEEVSSVAPSLAGHPQEAVVRTLEWGGRTRDSSAEFAAVKLGDVVAPMLHYISHWASRVRGAERFADRTVSFARNECWWWGNLDVPAIVTRQSGAPDKDRANSSLDLLKVSPWHPVAYADAIRLRDDWERFQKDAEAKHSEHPLVRMAIGYRLWKKGDYAAAVSWLEATVPHFGGKEAHAALADSYLGLGDEKRWLETRLAFAKQADLWLDRASNYREMARHYLITRRPREAQRYARLAGESGIYWALECEAFTEAVLGDKAACLRLVERIVGAYGGEISRRVEWYGVTGYGDPVALAGQIRDDPRTSPKYMGLSLEILGFPEEACERYLGIYEKESDNYFLLQAALLRLSLGEREQARGLLARIGKEFDRNREKDVSRKANRDLAALFLRSLDERPSVEAFRAEVESVRRAYLRPEREYNADLSYFAARFLIVEGDVSAGVRWLQEASHTDAGRYSLVLINHELRRHSVEPLDKFRPEAKAPSSEP